MLPDLGNLLLDLIRYALRKLSGQLLASFLEYAALDVFARILEGCFGVMRKICQVDSALAIVTGCAVVLRTLILTSVFFAELLGGLAAHGLRHTPLSAEAFAVVIEFQPELVATVKHQANLAREQEQREEAPTD